MKGPSPVDIIREQHWLEIAEYLGLKPVKVKSTFELWFRLLSELGYDLTAKGMNGETAPSVSTKAETPAPAIEHSTLYQLVETALFEVTNRRAQGERISDQTEVRIIVDPILACLAAPGNTGD